MRKIMTGNTFRKWQEFKRFYLNSMKQAMSSFSWTSSKSCNFLKVTFTSFF